MDDRRFDGIARALGAGMGADKGISRRGGIRAAIGALAAGVAGEAAARQRGRGLAGKDQPDASGPCGTSNRCRRDGDCCTKYCAGGVCRCKPNHMKCTRGAHCCSGSCVNRRCDGGCRNEGSRCQDNFNCCSGLACVGGTCEASRKARCTASNCKGCCEGTTCRIGSTVMGCGANGAVCARCETGQTCDAGVCKAGGGGGGGGAPAGCTAATCPTGCCEDGVCKTGTEAGACGTGGDECSACGGATSLCKSQQCAAGVWTAVVALPGNLNGPLGLAASADGLRVLVADTNNDRIVDFSRPDAASTTWTENTQFGDSSSMDGTAGVAMPPGGQSAFIAATAMDYVTVWNYSSSSWASQGTFGTAFNTIRGIAVSPDQLTVWVSEWDADSVLQWSRSDASSTSWSQDTSFGSYGTGNDTSNLDKFDNPFGIALSEDLKMAIVADRSNGRVTVWTRPDTLKTSTWTAQAAFGSNTFDWPYGVALSPDTLTAYVADYNNARVQTWCRADADSTSWTFLAEFGANGSGTNLTDMKGPTGIAVSPDGSTAWVSDSVLKRVTVWTYA